MHALRRLMVGARSGANTTRRIRRAHGDTKQLPHGAAVRLHQWADAHTVCVVRVRVHKHGVVLRCQQHPVALVALAQLLHVHQHARERPSRQRHPLLLRAQRQWSASPSCCRSGARSATGRGRGRPRRRSSFCRRSGCRLHGYRRGRVCMQTHTHTAYKPAHALPLPSAVQYAAETYWCSMRVCMQASRCQRQPPCSDLCSAHKRAVGTAPRRSCCRVLPPVSLCSGDHRRCRASTALIAA
jgi:hypothetical protein